MEEHTASSSGLFLFADLGCTFLQDLESAVGAMRSLASARCSVARGSLDRGQIPEGAGPPAFLRKISDLS